MTQTKTPAKAASMESKDRVTSAGDIRNMYFAILGRKPESASVVTDRTGHSLVDTVGELLRSAEFTSTLDHITSGQGLPPRERIDDADLDAGSAWLSSLLGRAAGEGAPSWGSLLLEILRAPALMALRDPYGELQQAGQRLERIVAQERSTLNKLQSFLRFDPASFSRTATGRIYAVTPGAVDVTMAVASRGELPRVLPFFTDGLSVLEKNGRPETLNELIHATKSAAETGQLKHWLFDEATYLDSALHSPRISREVEVSASPYLQFLTVGDAIDLKPHPLFSAYAYKTLNPNVDLGGIGPFAHYIRHGMKEGLATSVLFDSEFYLARQPYVRQEIASGRYSSALEHFLRVGMRAGCSFSPDFDRHYYLDTHSDITGAINDGSLPSAEWHFIMSGAREGRQPNRFFNPRYYAERYPFIDEEMSRLGLNSLLEHFLLIGRQRGWRVNEPPVASSVDIDQAKALFEKRGRRAYAEALAGVFTIDATPAKAKMSVIVPISGQADFTAGFLKSACWAVDLLQFKRGVATEVIIVDNGSKDHTSALLDALPGVRVVHFDKPIGFPAAVNAGVSASRGEIILVANNDIEFQADAFLRIYDAIISNPKYGVVGAKVILPNETLQEVGSILDKNGGALGFGRAQDAVTSRGSRFIEVDYASGCFIAFTRADFDALGGFDEAYSPGYYEEVDFSLRMARDLGKPTVVDTGLAITHYEHASFAKGRPQTVNESLILRNRLRLKTNHADYFNAMRPKSLAESMEAGRKALSGKARILVVEDLIPSGLLGSGFGREEEILDIFTSMNIPYDIVALNGSSRVDEYKDPLARVFRAWMTGQTLEAVLEAHGSEYSHLWLCRTHNLGRATEAIRAAKKQSGLKVICDTEALSTLRVVEQMRVQGQDIDDANVHAMAAAELSDPVEVDLWIAVNRRERILMENLGVGPVTEIGHAISLGVGINVDAPFESRHRILFIGAVHELSSPNYDGLEWFLSQVYPKLANPNAVQLTIAGHWAPGLAEAFKTRFTDLNIDFQGSVSEIELAALYSETRVAIAPTRFAAGIPCKVIESVLAGVPIVMTDLLAEQLDIDSDPAIAFASRFDGGVAFANWIDTLYTDPKIWKLQKALQARTIGVKSTLQNLSRQVEVAIGLVGIA